MKHMSASRFGNNDDVTIDADDDVVTFKTRIFHFDAMRSLQSSLLFAPSAVITVTEKLTDRR